MSNEVRIRVTAKDEATAVLKNVESEMGRVARIASGVFIAGVARDGISSIEGLGKSVISTGINFNALKESANIAFTTMLGSGSQAQAMLGELQAFAAKTPFEFPDLIKGAQRMMAMGFAAEEVIPTLTAVGDAASAMGGGSELIDQVTRALGQMQAKGKTSGEEMLQLTEAGIPAWRYLAEAIGSSIPEAMKKVEQGTVGARTTIKAVTDGINQDFGGMMDRQSKTFSGMLSNLKDTFTQASGTVLEPFFNVAKDAMAGLVEDSGSPQLQTNLENISVSFLEIADSIYKAEQQLQNFFGILTEKRDISNPGTDLGNFIRKQLGLSDTSDKDVLKTILGQNQGGTFESNPDPFEVQINRIKQRQAITDPTMDDPGFQRLGDAASNAGKKTDDFAGALDTAKQKTMSLGDAFQGALSSLRSAASNLFANPTREQAGLSLNLDQAQLALDNMTYAARPMEEALDRASDAIGRHRDALQSQSDALDDSSFSLSQMSFSLGEASYGIDRQIKALRTRAAEPPKTPIEAKIRRLEGQKDAISDQQHQVSVAEHAISVQQHGIQVQERYLDAQEKGIQRQKDGVDRMVASQQRIVDAYSHQLQQLESEHKIRQDLLTLADQTLLSERQLNGMWAALMVKTQDFTGWLSRITDDSGMTLVNGFDDAMNVEALLAKTIRDEVNPQMLTFGGLVRDVSGALRGLLEQLSKPVGQASLPGMPPLMYSAGGP